MAELKFRSDKDTLIKRMYKIVTAFTVILVIVAITFTDYILNIEKKAAELYLEQSVLQTASNLKGRVKNDLNDLKILSAMLTASTSSFSESDVIRFMTQNITNERYHRLGFAYPDGKALRYEEKLGKLPYVNWIQESCFDDAMAGNPCFAETIEEPTARSGFVNRYYVPVFDKTGKVVGVLGSQIDSDVFKKILGLNNYNGKGFSHVVDSDGNYIIKSQNEKNPYPNFFESKAKFIGTTKENVQEALKTKDSGTFWFKWTDGKTYIASFGFIGHNNAFVLTDVPQDVLMLHVNTLLGGIAVIVLTIGVLLLSLLKYTNSLYKENEEAIYQVAFTDEVTESGNKTKFLLDTKEILETSGEDKYAMISMDITKFKVINELYGYKKANKILKDVYGIIKKNLTKGSTCARDFAATFIVLYKYEKEDFIVKYFINKIEEEISKYNENVMTKLTSNTESRVISKLATAFGIYFVADKNVPITQMCDRASLAKRCIKDNMINNYHFYDDGLRAELLQDKAIEDEMYTALEDNQFSMYLQPKFDMKTMEIVGAEALVRWIHPVRGIIPPMDFIPVFEKNGFVIMLDKYIWKQACVFLSERKIAGEKLFPISVNVSRLHLNNDAFIDELLKLTELYNIEPEFIELELTETACLNNESRFIEIANRLKKLGFTIAMDDFGTGYSSLNMLRCLPVDVLKLDRGFISDTIVDERGKIVVRNILEMANELNITTVAEGIETPEQAVFLKNAGCKIAQGFLYGRPMDVVKFTNTFLSGENSLYQDVD